jgi:hypothetical protein
MTYILFGLLGLSFIIFGSAYRAKQKQIKELEELLKEAFQKIDEKEEDFIQLTKKIVVK